MDKKIENKRLLIGCHLSSVKGFAAMGKNACDIDANTFAFFTRNPRGGKAKEIDEADVEKLKEILKEKHFGKLVAHAPYTLNPCSATEKTRNFAHMAMEDDMRRMEYLPGNYYNFHPGSHTEQGVETGISQIAETLNAILRPEYRTTVLLETMSGKGSEVGGRFEELRGIIDRAAHGDQIGVCLDACHVFDAGYDIVNDLDGVLTEFDRVIGLKRLRAVHLNDSRNALGSHKDRHEKIGQGSIGEEAFARIVRHPALKNLPFFLKLDRRGSHTVGKTCDRHKRPRASPVCDRRINVKSRQDHAEQDQKHAAPASGGVFVQSIIFARI